MTNSILKLCLLSLLAIAVEGLPVHVCAQDSQEPAMEKAESGARKPAVTPFHGKLKAVDGTAGTITVDKRTIRITSETKIIKAGKPATLDDAVAGEEVGGAYKKAEDGTLSATTVRFGPKTEEESGSKKKAAKMD
jgi:hypothetical protein